MIDEEQREALDMSLEDVLSLATGEEARLRRDDPERNDAFRWESQEMKSVTVHNSRFDEERPLKIRPDRSVRVR